MTKRINLCSFVHSYLFSLPLLSFHAFSFIPFPSFTNKRSDGPLRHTSSLSTKKETLRDNFRPHLLDYPYP
jgi:hypothetical protein